MHLETETVKHMVRMVLDTQAEELGCDDCFAQLDLFVELTLAGQSAAQAMPLVHAHLMRCRDCREEFEALLAVLRVLV